MSTLANGIQTEVIDAPFRPASSTSPMWGILSYLPLGTLKPCLEDGRDSNGRSLNTLINTLGKALVPQSHTVRDFKIDMLPWQSLTYSDKYMTKPQARLIRLSPKGFDLESITLFFLELLSWSGYKPGVLSPSFIHSFHNYLLKLCYAYTWHRPRLTLHDRTVRRSENEANIEENQTEMQSIGLDCWIQPNLKPLHSSL